MGKLIFFAVIGVAAYLIWWRGASLRKSEIAKDEAAKNRPETLVYDKEKDAYVPKKNKTRR